MISRVVRYTEDEWSNPVFRITALQSARAAAKRLNGRIIIKVRYARRLVEVARIDYIAARDGYMLERYAPNPETDY